MTAALKTAVTLAIAHGYAPRRVTVRGARRALCARERPDDSEVAAGAERRRARLEAELRALGFEAESLESDEMLRGSWGPAQHASHVDAC